MSVADLLAGSLVSIREEHREHARLLGALRSLPLDLHATLELHYWQRMTVQEIADALEVPLGTAKTRLRRAREIVRVHMSAAPQGVATSEPRDLDAWAFEVGRAIEPD